MDVLAGVGARVLGRVSVSAETAWNAARLIPIATNR
jgi:hypothetical protein